MFLYAAFARVAFDVTLLLACWSAAVRMHNYFLNNTLHLSVEFFDTTPLGRILSRFSKDIDIIDTKLPELLLDWIVCAIEVLSKIKLTYQLNLGYRREESENCLEFDIVFPKFPKK